MPSITLTEDQLVKHVKSGGIYRYLGEAILESTLEEYVVYQAVKDDKVWLRPKAEFLDGRFTTNVF